LFFMSAMPFILLSVLILIASFSEIIIFNEEILLTLCFICFVFFSYRYLGHSLFTMFDDRAKKFEIDILVAFESKHGAISAYVNDLIVSRLISGGLSLFLLTVDSYTVHLSSYRSYSVAKVLNLLFI